MKIFRSISGLLSLIGVVLLLTAAAVSARAAVVLGTGDGKVFNNFSLSPEVIAHEMAHGLVQNTSKLEYQDDSGACQWGATVVYLGYLGATSEANSRAVFPVLERTLHKIPRQTKNVLESFLRMLDQAEGEIQTAIAGYAAACADHEKPGTRRIARKIQNRLDMDPTPASR